MNEMPMPTTTSRIGDSTPMRRATTEVATTTAISPTTLSSPCTRESLSMERGRVMGTCEGGAGPETLHPHMRPAVT